MCHICSSAWCACVALAVIYIYIGVVIVTDSQYCMYEPYSATLSEYVNALRLCDTYTFYIGKFWHYIKITTYFCKIACFVFELSYVLNSLVWAVGLGTPFPDFNALPLHCQTEHWIYLFCLCWCLLKMSICVKYCLITVCPTFDHFIFMWPTRLSLVL